MTPSFIPATIEGDSSSSSNSREETVAEEVAAKNAKATGADGQKTKQNRRAEKSAQASAVEGAEGTRKAQ